LRLLGDKGEDIAARFLRKKGYRIIKRNYKTPSGEIDIIARDGDAVVFVEVKTRKGKLFGKPEEAVDRRKQKKIINTAFQFLIGMEEIPPARFDIVSIFIRGREKEIDHIENAFES